MIEVVASLTINPEEPEALQAYFNVAQKLIDKVGARVVQKIELGDDVIGEKASELLMLVEYADQEAVNRVFQSDEYQSIIPEREKAFLKYNVCFVVKNELVA